MLGQIVHDSAGTCTVSMENSQGLAVMLLARMKFCVGIGHVDHINCADRACILHTRCYQAGHCQVCTGQIMCSNLLKLLSFPPFKSVCKLCRPTEQILLKYM